MIKVYSLGSLKKRVGYFNKQVKLAYYYTDNAASSFIMKKSPLGQTKRITNQNIKDGWESKIPAIDGIANIYI